MLNATSPTIQWYDTVTGNVCIVLSSTAASQYPSTLIGDLSLKAPRVVIGANNYTDIYATFNNTYVNIPVDKYLRIEGSSSNNTTKALSIGGYGLVEVDAPGDVGGRFRIDNSGNVICKGNFTNGSSSYIFAGGLRLGGHDTGNTIYTTGKIMGITVDNGYNINFNTWTGATNTKMSINSAGVGIYNTSPWIDLNIGDCSVNGSSGSIVFGKNNGGGMRNFRMGMSSNLFFCIGDCGNVNNSSNTWTLQSAISYQAPASSFTISSTGTVILPYS